MNNKTKKIVIGSLFAALTTVTTMLKLPTPSFGYIHPGDSLVLMCGIILGPVAGALSAGIGSMFADIFSGYISFAPATLVIKAITALIAGLIFNHTNCNHTMRTIIAGIPGELFMVSGYYAYEVFLFITTAKSTTGTSLAAAMSASLMGVPFNILQGIAGILISLALLPVLLKINDIRDCIYHEMHSIKKDKQI
ncbi:ECF transporter S component [Lachnotalea glycerini]|uniref:ECF transporter S component n=1 Tax=Lachnotalea glycerini TaxID=1763509 RepID=A0A371JGT7_9FIRM|nr:ECF transporter S component [Lachnotalea glycerini]RDY31949.1 ECF transporter S component [Lachnotalea glycerini]